MKKTKLLLLAFMLSIPFMGNAAGDSTKTASDTLAALTKKVDSIKKVQDTLLAKMKAEADTAAGASIRASKAFAANPKLFYAHTYKDHKVESWIAYLVLAIFLYGVYYYFRNSALCRDDSYYPDNTLKEIEKRPYSFSKVQLLWWTLIIISCFIWFFAQYGVLLPFNQTSILLLSGGLVVRLFGKSIDNSQISRNKKNNQQRLNNQGRPLPTRHQDINDSQGFLTDILSDESGITVHRMQAVIFNIIYGVAFIAFFINSMKAQQYPFIEFEDWQLALLGISAAGYLSLKTMENSRDTDDTRTEEAVRNMNTFNQERNIRNNAVNNNINNEGNNNQQ